MSFFPKKYFLKSDEAELLDLYYDFNWYSEKRSLKDMAAFIAEKETMYVAKKALDSHSRSETHEHPPEI